MYGKDILIIGGACGRIGFGRVVRLLSSIPVVNGDFVVDHLGFVDYVEPIVIKAENRLYYQQFDKPYGKNYRRSK